MRTDTEALSPRKRGRPATETPAQRVERCERELQLARAAQKENERECDAIVGRATREEAETDGEFKAKLAGILRRRVTGQVAKALVAGSLALHEHLAPPPRPLRSLEGSADAPAAARQNEAA